MCELIQLHIKQKILAENATLGVVWISLFLFFWLALWRPSLLCHKSTLRGTWHVLSNGWSQNKEWLSSSPGDTSHSTPGKTGSIPSLHMPCCRVDPWTPVPVQGSHPELGTGTVLVLAWCCQHSAELTRFCKGFIQGKSCPIFSMRSYSQAICSKGSDVSGQRAGNFTWGKFSRCQHLGPSHTICFIAGHGGSFGYEYAKPLKVFRYT